MKIFKHITVMAVAAMALFTACDNIPEDERLIYIKPAAVSRAVLIEDFTGQRCLNCPEATATIHQLQEQYGDSVVIAVAIHSGPFAWNARHTSTMPLWTAEGDAYYEYWNIEHQPMGMVSRQAPSDYPTWAAQVYEQIQHTAPVSVRLNATVDANDRQLEVNTSMMAVDGAVAGKLQLWLVEDSIVSPQIMPDGSGVSDYVHNHVFRTSINGSWGEDVAMAEGETVAREATITVSDDYNLAHLRVVAFVYNSTGVLQATQQRLEISNYK